MVGFSYQAADEGAPMLAEARLLELIAEVRRSQEARAPRPSLELPPPEVFTPEAAIRATKAFWKVFERPNPWSDILGTFEQPVDG